MSKHLACLCLVVAAACGKSEPAESPSVVAKPAPAPTDPQSTADAWLDAIARGDTVAATSLVRDPVTVEVSGLVQRQEHCPRRAKTTPAEAVRCATMLRDVAERLKGGGLALPEDNIAPLSGRIPSTFVLSALTDNIRVEIEVVDANRIAGVRLLRRSGDELMTPTRMEEGSPPFVWEVGTQKLFVTVDIFAIRVKNGSQTFELNIEGAPTQTLQVIEGELLYEAIELLEKKPVGKFHRFASRIVWDATTNKPIVKNRWECDETQTPTCEAPAWVPERD